MLEKLNGLLGVLRGGSHPVEVGLSAALGALAGVAFGTNGLVVALFAVTLVLNVNKPAFGLVTAACGAAGWLASPVRAAAGRALLAWAPAASVCSGAANAPVGALMGLDSYSVVGGVAMGVPLAAAVGVAAWGLTRGFHRRMFELARSEGAAAAWLRNPFVRGLKWVVLGREEPDYEKTLSEGPKLLRKRGLVVLCVLLIAGAAGAFLDWGGPVRAPLEARLTELAGAKVDVGGLVLRPLAASLSVEGLEVTDRSRPSTNAFEARTLHADVSVAALLRKSLVIEEARLAGFRRGTPREESGAILAREPSMPEEEATPATLPAGAPTVDRYLDWPEWKGRFEDLHALVGRLRDYRDILVSSDGDAPASREEEAERRVAEDRARQDRAREVRRTVPDVLFKRIVVEDVRTGIDGFGPVDVAVENVAYPVRFAPGPLAIRIATKDGSGEIALEADLAEPGGPVRVLASFGGLSAAPVSDALGSGVPVRFSGGTMSVECEGKAGRGWIDVTVSVRCTGLVAEPRAGKRFLGLDGRELAAALGEMNEVAFRLVVSGDVARPRVSFEDDGLGRKLKEAATRALKDRARQEVAKERKKLEEKAKDKLKGLLENKAKGAGGLIDGLFDR